MKKILTLLFICCSFTFTASASHMMGGEITWECMNNGKYIFTMKLYRDCNGSSAPSSGQALTVSYHPSVTSIPLNFLSPSHDISPVCNNPLLQLKCLVFNTVSGNYIGGGTGNGATEELIYRSDTITLVGIPPPSGWIFSWSLCCRNAGITNLVNASSRGMTLRAKMFAYSENGVLKNANPCFDSSPSFAERPISIMCTGYPFTYSENSYDKELDSLAYQWDKPLDDLITPSIFTNTNPQAIAFVAGYSYTSPFPGIAQDSNNIPANLNPVTGEINYTSFTAGGFDAVVRASSFKNGQLVAEIYRDFQHLVLPCGLANLPPVVTPPFNSSSFDTSITIGSSISFNLLATDIGFIPGSPPIPQSVVIFAAGEQFDTSSFSAASLNCNKPPCAGLTPFPGTYSTTSNSLQFNWQTSCENLKSDSGSYVPSRTFSFIIKSQDNYCPAPAIQVKTIKITLNGIAVIAAPQIISTQVASSNDVTLMWQPPQDPTSTFNAYFIYASTSRNGPYTLMDSVFTYSTDSIVIPNTTANSNPVYFYMKSRSGCYGSILSASSDTISTIFVAARNIGNNHALLNWNNPKINLSPTYTVFRKVGIDWIQIAQAINTTNFTDSISLCNTLVNYKVEFTNSSSPKTISSVGNEIMSVYIAIDTIIGTAGGVQNGAIELSVNGGNPPYQFLWNTNQTTEDIVNLGVGFYSLTITDNAGCVLSKTNIEVQNTIGITNITEDKTFVLTPNPASEKYTIFSLVNATLKGYNKNGELVLSSQIHKGINRVC